MAADASGKALVLASASPRRRELLERVGLSFEVLAADIDEALRAGEAADEYVRRMAMEKAAAVAAKRAGHAVLAADTIVVHERRILGKPSSAEQALAMLSALCGARHQVTTAFALHSADAVAIEAVTTVVRMREASRDELDAYVASGEWRGKAGGYAIQGIAAALVVAIEGSVTNVIGLPLAEVLECLTTAGVARADFAAGQPA